MINKISHGDFPVGYFHSKNYSKNPETFQLVIFHSRHFPSAFSHPGNYPLQVFATRVFPPWKLPTAGICHRGFPSLEITHFRYLPPWFSLPGNYPLQVFATQVFPTWKLHTAGICHSGFPHWKLHTPDMCHPGSSFHGCEFNLNSKSRYI